MRTTFTVDENTTAVATLTADDSDTAVTDLTWSKTGGADSGKFSLTSAGVLTFSTAPDYEAPADADTDHVYEVTVQVSDGTTPVTADLEVTVENVAELTTTITGPEEVDYAENDAIRVATFAASSEADRAGIEWILTGADAEHFSIDTPAGVLRFHIDPVAPNLFPKLPDYEAPDDDDADNAYEVSLLARVGSTTTAPLSVTVTVDDVDEAGDARAVQYPPTEGVRADRDADGPGRRDRRHGGLAVGALGGPQRLGRDRRRRRRELHAGGGGHEHVSAGDGDLRGRARDRQDGQRGGAQRGHGAPVDGSDGGER